MTLTPHSIIHGDACFAYFNKIWGIPTVNSGRDKHLLLSAIGLAALVQQLETQEGKDPRARNRAAFPFNWADSNF
jgi:hypothetical protein